jgi:hypothetical protein
LIAAQRSAPADATGFPLILSPFGLFWGVIWALNDSDGKMEMEKSQIEHWDCLNSASLIRASYFIQILLQLKLCS